MNSFYKSGWEETKDRYEAWWAHEYFGRCALHVTAPKGGVPNAPAPALPEKVEDRWLDHPYISAVNEYNMGRTFYGAEAFPLWNPGYPGWDFIPAYLGAPVTLMEETGWIDPVIHRGSLQDYDYGTLKIADDNRWWIKAKEMLKFSVLDSRDTSIPGILAIGGSGDILAALRGSENLLADMVDCPDYVREFDQHLIRLWMKVYNIQYDIICGAAEGSTCWDALWSSGKSYALSNDFAYMISPKMFRDVFLESVEMQTQFLDHCLYHVDGEGNFAHVDALCELPKLQALQILPGAGKPSPLYYMDVLKKVQAAGKNLWIMIPADEVETALENLSARGLYICTSCASEEEARLLIKDCERWSKDR